MADVLRIKRRAAGGAAGAPAALAAAEIAFNEQDNTLYYGKGDSFGNATSILPIGGPGAFSQVGHTHVAANITDFAEAVDDRVAALIVPGSNISVTYNDAANTFTIASTAGASAVAISDTPPGSPTPGQLWWESDTAIMWLYYNDGNSSQWVQISGGGGGSGAGGTGVTDGDKGDIIVSGGGTSWLFDPTVVTPAAKTVLDDATTAAMLATLGGLPLAGGTLTGNVNVVTTNPLVIYQKGASGESVQLFGRTGASPRWNVVLGDTAAESGSNAGSNFAIGRWSDAGALIDVPLSINRATAAVTLTGDVTIGKANPALVLNKSAAGQNIVIASQKGGVSRWLMEYGDASAESGSNAGSNFNIHRYADNGSWIATAFSLNRADGRFIFSSGGSISGDLYIWRASATSTGVVFFGSSGSQYLYFDGTNFNLTSQLVLPGDPTAGTGAATKQMVDGKLPLTGGSLSGDLTLNRSSQPGVGLIWFGNAGQYMYGDGSNFYTSTQIALPVDPSAAMHAATKQYVDARGAAPQAVAKAGCFTSATGGTWSTYNLSSVTDNGAGVTTFNWTVAISGGNSRPAGGLGLNTGALRAHGFATPGTSSVVMYAFSGATLLDPDYYWVTVFGDIG